MTPILARFLPFLAAALVLVGAAEPAFAQQGTALLTVAGKIAKTNRGPVDVFADPHFNGLDLEFDEAFTFDAAALMALGMKKLTATYPGSDRKVEVEGPLLADVLKAVGAKGETVAAVAIDGYTAEIPMSDVAAFPIVLALKSGGKWLAVGGRGPTWIVYPRDDFPALAARDDSLWVWGTFFLHVE